MMNPLLATYNRSKLSFSSGQGAYLFTPNKERYLDFASGIAVNSLGHNHPHLVKALNQQSKKLWHCSNMYQIALQEKAARRLVKNTFADSVFFCNSGAEAIEAGIKIVRRFFFQEHKGKKYRIICAGNAFHGRTFAAIAASGQKKMLEGFGPVLQGFDHVEFGNLRAVRDKINQRTAAILVEPVQGEGGVNIASREYMKALRSLANKKKLLLFFDEVQCGVGRTGKFSAHEWSGVKPDIMSIAKGIGGGFPVGACLVTSKVSRCMNQGTHGSTYGGNPLAMAVVNAVLDIIPRKRFLADVCVLGDLLKKDLYAIQKRYPNIILGIRGIGLMLGLQCVVPNTVFLQSLRKNGLLTAAAGENVIRLLPPLNITKKHVTEAIKIINKTAKELC